MSYFAALIRQTGMSGGSPPTTAMTQAPAGREAIEVVEARVAEPAAERHSEAVTGHRSVAAMAMPVPGHQSVPALVVDGGSFERPREDRPLAGRNGSEEGRLRTETGNSRYRPLTRQVAPDVSPEPDRPLPESDAAPARRLSRIRQSDEPVVAPGPEPPPSLTPARPTLSEVRAWVTRPPLDPPMTETGPDRGAATAFDPARFSPPEFAGWVAPPNAESILEIGTIQITFEEPPAAPEPRPVASSTPQSSPPGVRLSRHYLR